MISDDIYFLEYPIPAAPAPPARHKKRHMAISRDQAWYHRSAGVKTTGEKFWIRKFKIKKKRCRKWSKMVKNGQNSQNGLK